MKKQRLDVMIDIETMSTNRDRGMVVSVAWVPFFLDGSEIHEEPGNIFINMESSAQNGRIYDVETHRWWLRQPNYRLLMYNLREYGLGYTEAWRRFYNEMKGLFAEYVLYVWSRGIDFDFPMIESSLRDAQITDPLPWRYYNKCDVRTLVKIAQLAGYEPPVREALNNKHDALDDCVFQIKEVQGALEFLGIPLRM